MAASTKIGQIWERSAHSIGLKKAPMNKIYPEREPRVMSTGMYRYPDSGETVRMEAYHTGTPDQYSLLRIGFNLKHPDVYREQFELLILSGRDALLWLAVQDEILSRTLPVDMVWTPNKILHTDRFPHYARFMRFFGVTEGERVMAVKSATVGGNLSVFPMRQPAARPDVREGAAAPAPAR